MLTTLGKIFIAFACIGLFVLALIVFPSFRNFIRKTIRKIGLLVKKHWLASLCIVVFVLALILKDQAILLFSAFSKIAFIVLGICILLWAVCRKSKAIKKIAFRVGALSLGLILLTVILEKLPW